jgi:uncharacterized membrane protein YccC
MLRPALRDALSIDRTGLAVGHAVRRTVALLLILAAALALGRPELALYPIVGAVVVGFGSIRPLGLSRATPMFAASIGTAFAAFAGSVVGANPWLTAAALVPAGLAYGLLAAVGPGTAWVSLNCLVFFLVLGLPYPAPPGLAFRHALLVLAGGLTQSLVLTAFYYVRRRLGREHPSAWFASTSDLRASAHRVLASFFHGPKGQAEALAYGLRMTAALEASEALGHAIHLQRSAWIAMTAALVLKSDLQQTLARGIGRCAGTLAGGLLATLLVVLFRPSHTGLSLLSVASVALAYLFFYANYAICTVFVTGYVVFLLAFGGLPGPEVAWLRIGSTLAGGAIALLAAASPPRGCSR